MNKISDQKKPIWNRRPEVDLLNQRSQKTMVEHLGMSITEVGDDYLKGTMPVDSRTHQPMGILHGGASVAFAESLASMAGNFVVNQSESYCVGLEINANHVKSVREGLVEGVARPLHLGKQTQIWEIHITQNQNLVCVSRMTLMVMSKKK